MKKSNIFYPIFLPFGSTNHCTSFIPRFVVVAAIDGWNDTLVVTLKNYLGKAVFYREIYCKDHCLSFWHHWNVSSIRHPRHRRNHIPFPISKNGVDTPIIIHT